MQKFSAPFKVGLVIIVGLIVTIIMIIRFSASWGKGSELIELHAYFEDATGLAVRSQVQVAGIQVGEVASIKLENNRAHVVFNVRDDVPMYTGICDTENYCRNGATVAKKLSGILGDYHLELTPGLEGERLKSGDKIPNVIQAGGAEALLNDAGKIMKDVSQVTEMLSTVLGGEDGQQKIAKLLDDLNHTMEGINSITNDNAEKIASILSNVDTITKNASEISETGNHELTELAKELTKTLQQLRETVNHIDSGVGGTLDSAQGSLDQLRASIDRLDRTLSNVETIAQNVNNGEGTVGKLLKDDSIANEAQALLTETRELIRSGTETVDGANSLLKPVSDLNVDIALRGDYLVNANSFKVDFGVKLQPSYNKYYYLGLVMDPHGTSKKKTVLTESSTSGPVYETVTTNDDSVKFNLQYAATWRWFTGRFGVFENTGGLGGDVEMFSKNWKISFDVFAFNDNPFPRVRGTTLLYFSLFTPESWTWARTFYLSAGFDDPLNLNVFDYFFGIGFRFNDNDVKSVMSVMPSIK